MMTRYELYPGKLVTHMDEVARVLKVNPKTILVEHESGKRWKTYPSHLTPAPEGTVFESKLGDEADVTLGTVVKFRDGRHPGLFVVCAMTNSGLRIARLGGDGGKYFYNIRPVDLTVVSVEALSW